MQYIEAVSYENPKFKSLFLAGGITNCPDWQNVIVNELTEFEISIFNPRRKIFNIEIAEESQKQIIWEYKRLREADILIFWFSEGSINPITLFEYGSALERNQKIFVGTHHNYERKTDIMIQTKLRQPEINVNHSLESLIAETKNYLKLNN